MTNSNGTKACKTCGQVKPLSEFSNDAASKDGKRYQCKQCSRERCRLYHKNNKDKRKVYQKKYYEENKDALSAYGKEYREANKEKIAEANKNWRKKNKEKIKNKKREEYTANKEQILADRKDYYERNKDEVKRRTHKYTVSRYQSDPMFNLEMRLRRRTRSALDGRGFTKTKRTQEMLGCTYEELMQHLESQFVEGMTWDNRSEWHIDHIVPLASAETEEELIALCHYTNLQPLWAADNLKKSDSRDWSN